jgi:uracil-DNA glycosylase family protein
MEDLLNDAPDIASLAALREAEARCRRCALYKRATQVVPGEGPAHARLMLVGEQPGNDEDLAGEPFVGPAGRMLDRALNDAGLERRKLYITNAVKHFKFEPRGKRRLHRRPDAKEIDACRLWQDFERKLVRPRLVVALGATAARSLLHRVVTISKLRGAPHPLEDGGRVLVTIHPSYLLRIRDEADARAEYARFVADLKQAGKLAAAA